MAGTVDGCALVTFELCGCGRLFIQLHHVPVLLLVLGADSFVLTQRSGAAFRSPGFPSTWTPTQRPWQL